MTTPTQPQEQNVVFDCKEIIRMLPHRYPFLLVDRIIHLDAQAGVIIGQKNLTFNESFFQGHFPDRPIMPGVLILEALAQAGGILIYRQGFTDKIALLLSMNNIKFRNPAGPGDVLHLHVEMLHFTSKAGRVKAKAMVGEKLAAEAEIGFVLVDKNQI